MNTIYIIPDSHCRSFYKPILQVKDKPVVFLGDYMDPYWWEGFNDKEGIEKLNEIIEFARNNKNVTLLVGNHTLSWIWSKMGFERTSQLYYKELHKLYRDNIDLFHPIHKIGDTIFTHAGISSGWITTMNRHFEYDGKDFRLTQDNIIPYIENEFQLELQNDVAPNEHFGYASLNSPIFCIGRSRGGDAPYGGPFWNDFYDDYHDHPEGWDCYQICGHQQREMTGSIGIQDGLACVDSRAIFEYDLDTHLIKPSQLNNEETKEKIADLYWQGATIRFNKDIKKGE